MTPNKQVSAQKYPQHTPLLFKTFFHTKISFCFLRSPSLEYKFHESRDVSCEDGHGFRIHPFVSPAGSGSEFISTLKELMV